MINYLERKSKGLIVTTKVIGTVFEVQYKTFSAEDGKELTVNSMRFEINDLKARKDQLNKELEEITAMLADYKELLPK